MKNLLLVLVAVVMLGAVANAAWEDYDPRATSQCSTNGTMNDGKKFVYTGPVAKTRAHAMLAVKQAFTREFGGTAKRSRLKCWEVK